MRKRLRSNSSSIFKNDELNQYYTMGMFKKAKEQSKRLRVYMYGESGAGKTIAALNFPKPAVIDTEKGTRHYGGDFDFDVIHSAKFSDVLEAIEHIKNNPGEYLTLVVDSFSDIWDKMKTDLELHLRKKKGDPNYTLSGLDYGPLKDNIKMMMRKLNQLDINVVLTARGKNKYSNEGDDFMKKIGTKPEGPSYLPHMMDVFIEIEKDIDSGARTANVKKDRTNTLPPHFPFSYQKMVEHFGIDDLEREPVDTYSSDGNRNTKVVINGEEKKTAGVTAEQIEEIRETLQDRKIGNEELKEILQNDYSVSSILDLRKDEADLLIQELNQN